MQGQVELAKPRQATGPATVSSIGRHHTYWYKGTSIGSQSRKSIQATWRPTLLPSLAKK